MSDDSEYIFLDVESTLIKCKKDDLTKHSDYFKAMLEGNFIERGKTHIKIEVSFRTFYIYRVITTVKEISMQKIIFYYS